MVFQAAAPKFQIPNPKLQTNSKSQTSTVRSHHQAAFGFWTLEFIWILDFGFWSFIPVPSWLHRKLFLLFRFLHLVLPLPDAALHAAEREKFLLVVNHLLASQATERVVLEQEDRFLRADLLAIAAEDAAEHVDLEFPGHLLGVGPVGVARHRAGRCDANRLRRADELAKLARDALGVAVLVLHEIRRAAIV